MAAGHISNIATANSKVVRASEETGKPTHRLITGDDKPLWQTIRPPIKATIGSRAQGVRRRNKKSANKAPLQNGIKTGNRPIRLHNFETLHTSATALFCQQGEESLHWPLQAYHPKKDLLATHRSPKAREQLIRSAQSKDKGLQNLQAIPRRTASRQNTKRLNITGKA
ncbi:hypothetical protein Nepgr_007875 [Nepenthes gracilis]|uniref:Uncharacterized protein n=1 Tax=Nepenthes gracilis TaxID=150966 RepID=A0AAD3S7T0_NEPGR|nr:hypothetical protein Nepgr_007875 [Nepenthes gracilis]